MDFDKAEQLEILHALQDMGEAVCGHHDEGWDKYYLKHHRFIRLDGEIVAEIDAGRIETAFCFPDELEGCDEMCRAAKTHDWFMRENMRGWWTDEQLGGGVDLYAVRHVGEGGRVSMLAYVREGRLEDRVAAYRRAEEDSERLAGVRLEQFAAGYRAAREAFRRRCEAWYKRFGASKIRTWKYWADA